MSALAESGMSALAENDMSALAESGMSALAMKGIQGVRVILSDLEAGMTSPEVIT